jgi:uncharacterized protein YbcC (UPF0753/DUF2309 family)
LQLECSERETGALRGYAVDEMAAVCETTLRNIGLAGHFARLILVIAHGAGELEQYRAARFGCGICGSADGANSRALAKMMNDGRVRKTLGELGIMIPPETFFVGGFHDTSTQTVRFFDIDRLPDSHREEFYVIERALDSACQEYAREKASGDSESSHLDYGHARNAVCVVGRRSHTRTISLDGRAFLVSYDPTHDEDGSILGRLIANTVVPCIDVNLQYYFSHVEPNTWGCGNTLPWHASSPLGVVEESSVDVRSGLSWPLVRDHEPLRLLVVIESPPERLMQAMANNERFAMLCSNGWIRLALLHPKSFDLHVYCAGQFTSLHKTSLSLIANAL